MKLAPVIGFVIAAGGFTPALAQAPSGLRLEGWVMATPSWDRAELSAVTQRALGVALGLEGGVAWNWAALRFGYQSGPLKPDGFPVDRDRIEGFAVIGVTPIRALGLYAGPHARAVVVDGRTERWWWWEVRARGVVPIVRSLVDAYADVWTAVAGSVAPAQPFGHARGGSAGVMVRLPSIPIGLRLGYGVDVVGAGANGRRETIEGLTIALGEFQF